MAQKDREHIRKLREEANAIRRQEEAKRRRKRMYAQIGIVAGAVVVITLVVLSFTWLPSVFSTRGPLTSSGTITLEGQDGPAEQPIQANPEGYIAIGAADAPVTIDYYYDYSCPHCVQYHGIMSGEFSNLMATGQVKINYRPVQFVAPYGRQAGAVVLAAAQHQPELFLQASDGLFSVPAETQTGWTKQNYVALLPTLGITSPEATKAVQDGVYLPVIDDTTRKAREAKVTGTPSLAVNGEIQQQMPTSPEELRKIVTDKGAKLPEAKEPATPAAPAPAPTPAG